MKLLCQAVISLEFLHLTWTSLLCRLVCDTNLFSKALTPFLYTYKRADGFKIICLNIVMLYVAVPFLDRMIAFEYIIANEDGHFKKEALTKCLHRQVSKHERRPQQLAEKTDFPSSPRDKSIHSLRNLGSFLKNVDYWFYFDLPTQQKTHFCLPTKVRFLNEARLRRMKNEAGLRPMKCAFGT